MKGSSLKTKIIAALYFVMLSALGSLLFCPPSMRTDLAGIAAAMWVLVEWIDVFS